MGSGSIREVSAVTSAVVFGCSWVCCLPCDLTSACLVGFGAGVGLTDVSTVTRLTTV